MMPTIPSPVSSFPKVYEIFQSLKTPFYLIVMVSVFTLINTVPYAITDSKWLAIVITIAIVLFFVLSLNLVGGRITDEQYIVQLRFARSIGIAGAILCFFIAGDEVLIDNWQFTIVFIPCVMQIIILILYTLIRDKEVNNLDKEMQPQSLDIAKKRINLIQLCLMSTSLLIGISTNSAFSKIEKSRKTIASLCLTNNIINTLGSLSDTSISNLNSVNRIHSFYDTLKAINFNLKSKIMEMDEFLDTSTKRKVNEKMQLLKDAIETEKSEKTEDEELIFLLGKVSDGYGLAVNLKEEFERNSKTIDSYVTPETDSLITKLLNTLKEQKILIDELNLCYKEVKKLDYPRPENLDWRYNIISLILLSLWGVCMIIWIKSLFAKS